MSQLKDYSQVSQEQLFEALQEYALTPDVVEFLKEHPAILVALLDFISDTEEKFPDCRVELKTSINDGERKLQRKLRINILAPERTVDIIIRFNEFKEVWWLDKYDDLRNLSLLNIKFPDSDETDARERMRSLIGTVEGPSDWASEIDHYLYGTPKRNR